MNCWARLEAEVRRRRREDREAALDSVVKAASAYGAECSRADAAHGARLSQREAALRRAIDDAHRALHPGPISKAELELAEAEMRARENAPAAPVVRLDARRRQPRP